MCQNSEAALFMNRGDGFSYRHAFGNGLGNPQTDDMPAARGDFHTGDNIERVAITLLISPQTGIQHIVIGDGDDVQITPVGNALQNLSSGCEAIAGTGVHVNIGTTSELSH